MNQATETKEDVDDIKVTEAADGSATVDLPDGFVAEDEDGDDKPPASANKDDDGDDGDDDHGSDDDADLTEAKRSKRRAKRELARRAREEKDQMLISMRRQNTELMERIANLERKQGSADLARLTKAIEDEQLKLDYAKAKMEEATSNSDGATFAKAQEMWYETRQKLESMNRLKQNQARQAVADNSPTNPKIRQNATQWLERNDWYNPAGKDLDSKITKAVDETLLDEGWDPASNDYWEELDRRLSKRLPHRYTDDTDETVTTERKRRSVVTGSGRESVTGSGGSGGKSFILDAEQVRAMKDAGLWDDPVKRARMVKRYAEQARQQRNRS